MRTKMNICCSALARARSEAALLRCCKKRGQKFHTRMSPRCCLIRRYMTLFKAFSVFLVKGWAVKRAAFPFE